MNGAWTKHINMEAMQDFEPIEVAACIASLTYREHPECIAIDSIRDRGGGGKQTA